MEKIFNKHYRKELLSSDSAKPHMLANYHDVYVEKSKFNLVKTVLGAAQLGAVGYLAYRSIKKYGFW